jgi:uncharacterized membrane protein
MRISLLFAASIGLIFTGLALVLLSSTSRGFTGGCFFWPFPILIACGVGTTGSAYVPIILAAIILLVMVVFSLFLAREPPQDLKKSDQNLESE